MNDTNEQPDLKAAVERLAEVVERMRSSASNDAAGPTRDAAGQPSPVRSGTARPGEGDGEGRWNAVGETIARSIARVLTEHLDKLRTNAPAKEQRGTGGGTVPASASAKPPGRLRRLGNWMVGNRVGRAVRTAGHKVGGSKVGRTAKKVGGVVAGSMAGRAIGAAVGSVVPGVGTMIGGIAGGLIGGRVGASAGGTGKGLGFGATTDGATGALVGGALGGLPGAVGGGVLGAAAGGAAGALTGFAKNAEETSKRLQEMNRRMGSFSGLMNQIETEAEARDRFRSREIGDRLSSSAKFAMEADQARKNNTKETELLGARIENNLGAIRNYAAVIVNWPINKIARLLNRLFPGDDAESTTLFESAQKLAKELDEEDRIARERMNNDPAPK